jgi:hypothetical protein
VPTSVGQRDTGWNVPDEGDWPELLEGGDTTPTSRAQVIEMQRRDSLMNEQRGF